MQKKTVLKPTQVDKLNKLRQDMLIKKATDANAQQRKIKLEAEIKLATKNHTNPLF